MPDEWHLKSIHLSRVLQEIGSIKSHDGHLLYDGIMGLRRNGWSDEDIIDAVKLEFKIE
jgi:hypothetical protein